MTLKDIITHPETPKVLWPGTPLHPGPRSLTSQAKLHVHVHAPKRKALTSSDVRWPIHKDSPHDSGTVSMRARGPGLRRDIPTCNCSFRWRLGAHEKTLTRARAGIKSTVSSRPWLYIYNVSIFRPGDFPMNGMEVGFGNLNHSVSAWAVPP